MTKKLIIAEKPELARAIAAALIPGAKENGGVIESDQYMITNAYGHLLTLASPETYDAKYADRKDISLLPIYFRNWQRAKYSSDKLAYATKRLELIGRLLKTVDTVIHCGDPDEEGQLLIDEILEYYHFNGKVERVLINDNLPENIQKAFQQIKPNDQYRNMGKMAYARQMADLCFGINHSRLATNRLHQFLTVGRVQTPTLALVVNRDRAIQNHTKTMYYTLNALFNIDQKQLKFDFKPNKDFLAGEEYVLHKDQYHPVIELIQGKKFSFEFKNTIKQIAPPLPYNATELQADMNGRYGYSLSDTMKATQELRDRYRAITYNRSDCQYLSEEHYHNANQVMPFIFGNIGIEYPVDYTIHSKCFDDSKISAHHGIIPQKVNLDLSELTDIQRNVYVAICERYVMQFLKPVKKNICNCSYPIQYGQLSYSASSVIDPGYRSFFKEMDEEEQEQSIVIPDGIYPGGYISHQINEKETKPLAKYTPKTLIKDMCGISKYVKDEKLKQVLKEKDKGKVGEHGSIGTVATRAAIIDHLIQKGFLTMDGKNIVSTKLGQEFCSIIPEEIKSAELTAKWWIMLEDVKSGTLDPNEVMIDVVNDFKENKDKYYQGSISIPNQEKEIYGKCPKCQGDIIKAKSRKTNQFIYFCSNYKDKQCRFTLSENFKRFNDMIHLTDKKVKALLSGQTITENLTSKTGDKYKANLKLEIVNDFVNLSPIKQDFGQKKGKKSNFKKR